MDRKIYVEDVMKYYGKWIGSEESALVVIEHTKRMTPKFSALSYSNKLRAIRDYLIYEMGCKDIPATPTYRRAELDE